MIWEIQLKDKEKWEKLLKSDKTTFIVELQLLLIKERPRDRKNQIGIGGPFEKSSW